ncbi:MAG: hypothetical protein AAB417_02080 [Patescibacteria group bacterium]
MRAITYFRYHSGVAALFLVVVVGASALLMAVGASLLGIGELTMGFMSAQGEETLSLADGCLEEALERIRYNPVISEIILETNVPVYPAGSCTIDMVDILGPQIELTITATKDGYYKKIVAVVDPTFSGPQLISWTEVSN